MSYSSSCRNLKEDSSSYVVEALKPECKNSSIRFSLGVDTKEKDIHKAVSILKKALNQVSLQ